MLLHTTMNTPKLKISPKQYEALRLVCNTFIPAMENEENHQNTGFWRLKATDLEVPDRILELAARLPLPEQKELKQLLTLLASPVFGLTCRSGLHSIRQMPFNQREKALQSWSKSRFAVLRKAFNVLRKLTTFFHYGISYQNLPNPSWEAIGYLGPLQQPVQAPKPIQPYTAHGDSELTCDVVVVGSGAGGGLAAGMLAEAGFEVILLEKGEYLNESDFNQREADMIQRSYEQQGALTTNNGSVGILAGSCLGGGTTINWTGALRTPDYILQEWASEHQLRHLTGQQYAKSLDAVMEAAGVTQSESNHNVQNRFLWRGSELLGDTPKIIPRNVEGCSADGCKSCGYCGFGCQAGNKKGTLKTWIQRAYQAGARIMVQTAAQKVLVKRGSVAGVEALQIHPSGRKCRVLVKASCVIVAAGALHTPALLLKSGIHHPVIGQNLFFHPTVLVSGLYNQPVNPWWGTMMSALNDAAARFTDNYGVRLETPPVHPGLWATATPWQNALQHKAHMLRMAQTANFIVLTRDKFGGNITLDRKGNATYHYNLNRYDLKHLLAGIEKAARIHLAAGAEEIVFPHHQLRHVTGNTNESALLKFFTQMPEWGWKPGQFSLFTAHQMGTCRMGGNPKTHPLSPEGQVNGVKGLYVADASAFPASSGVNPMISIMALSHYTIQQIISKK